MNDMVSVSKDGEPTKQPPRKSKSQRSGDTAGASTSGNTSCGARPPPGSIEPREEYVDESVSEEEREAREASVRRYVTQHRLMGRVDERRAKQDFMEKRNILYKEGGKYFEEPAAKPQSSPSRDLCGKIPDNAKGKDRRVMARASSSTPRRESETGSHVSRKSTKYKLSASSSKSSPRDPKQCLTNNQRRIEHQTRKLYHTSRPEIDPKDLWKSKCGATCW